MLEQADITVWMFFLNYLRETSRGEIRDQEVKSHKTWFLCIWTKGFFALYVINNMETSLFSYIHASPY